NRRGSSPAACGALKPISVMGRGAMTAEQPLLDERDDKLRQITVQLDALGRFIEAGDLQIDRLASGLGNADKIDLVARCHFDEARPRRSHAIEQAMAGEDQRLQLTAIEIEVKRATKAVADRHHARKRVAWRQLLTHAGAVES